jgi:hypothetical protein
MIPGDGGNRTPGSTSPNSPNENYDESVLLKNESLEPALNVEAKNFDSMEKHIDVLHVGLNTNKRHGG